MGCKKKKRMMKMEDSELDSKLCALHTSWIQRACRQMAKSVVKSGLAKSCTVRLSYAFGAPKPLSLFVETYGSECGKLHADDIANILKVEFDCRPPATSLALHGPSHQETAAHCHFEDSNKFSERELSKDMAKYVSMGSKEVTAAL